MLAELHLVWLRGDGLYSVCREFPSKLWGRISYACLPTIVVKVKLKGYSVSSGNAVSSWESIWTSISVQGEAVSTYTAVSVSVYLPVIVRPSFPTLGWSQVSGRPVPLSLRGSRATPLVSLAQWGPVLPARTTSPCSHTPLPTYDLP